MHRFIAALTVFTRIPVWKLFSPPQSAYSGVTVFLPLVGWITGGVTALLMFGLSFILPWPVAVVLALASRLLLTGALHEDGLADFCDAFGCGGSRERILAIMKDSHIGTYGVIGLIVYFLLAVGLLSSFPPAYAAWAFFAADPLAKFCSAMLTNLLPYARPEGAKNGISYARMSLPDLILCALFGFLPLTAACILTGWILASAAIMPAVTLAWLTITMRRKIGGYTGDCCGATYIICEICFLLTASITITAI